MNYATYTSLQQAQGVQRLISLWSGLGEAPARGPKGAGAPLAAIVVDISGYFLLLQLLLLVKWLVFQFFVHEVFWIVHGVHRALLHITSIQKFARFKSYVNSLCCLIFYILTLNCVRMLLFELELCLY